MSSSPAAQRRKSTGTTVVPQHAVSAQGQPNQVLIGRNQYPQEEGEPVAFDETEDAGLLDFLNTVLPHEDVHLSDDQIQALFRARCEDQGIAVNLDRLGRFRDFLVKSCAGLLFSAREAGLGERSCVVLAKIFKSNSNYSQLDLSGNRLHDEGAVYISSLLASPTCHIVRLAVGNCEISKRGVSSIFEPLISTNVTLTSLDIHRNHMGQKSCELLGTILAENQVLYDLNVASTGFGPDGMREIALGLGMNSTLRILNLAANSIGAEGIRHFVQHCMAIVGATSSFSSGDALRSVPMNTSRFAVTRLNLARNNLGDRGMSILCRALVDTRGKHPLQELDLSENGFTTEGFSALSNLIRQDHVIQVLSVSRNVWTAQVSASEFADALASNGTITRISLSQCKIYDEAGSMILEACSRMSSLQLLDVSQNYLGDESGKMLAKCIFASVGSSANSSLAPMRYGSAALAPTLGVKGTIARIVADKNRIGDAGGFAIAEALKGNRDTFLSLRMSNNKIRDAGELIATVLSEKNEYVRDADFSMNEMKYEHIIAIQQAVARNLVRHKNSKTERLQNQISSLAYQEDHLTMTSKMCEEERVRLERARQTVIVRKEELEVLKTAMDQEKKHLEGLQKDAVNERLDKETRLEDLNREISIIKANGETKQAMVVARIENETKKRAAIAKSTKRKEQDLEEERRKQEEDVKPLKEQVEKTKRRALMAEKELKEEQSSLAEYVDTWKLDATHFDAVVHEPKYDPQAAASSTV
eukprot:ANDGO_05804.mRNA.1 Protein CARMIL